MVKIPERRYNMARMHLGLNLVLRFQNRLNSQLAEIAVVWRKDDPIEQDKEAQNWYRCDENCRSDMDGILLDAFPTISA